jgi:thiosulfate/3-mercaptopyruvate sulfurtransferase
MSDAGRLVSTAWLAEHLAEPDVRVADASWYLPQAGRNARAEYEAAHIEGAVFFDIDALSDQNTDLPHMLPHPVAFSSAMRKLSIGDADFVVFYDGAGIYSAPRGLWMMRAMGHERCAVLDGGLPKWTREGRAASGTAKRRPGIGRPHFTAAPEPQMVRHFAALRANVQARSEQLVDARSPSRFRGEEAEPRPGVRPGHIPGAINVHYAEVLTPEGTMRPAQELRRLFADRGIDLNRPIVTSCGSGVTAAILSLALEIAGAEQTALYDGSWAEWGGRPDAPIATGA